MLEDGTSRLELFSSIRVGSNLKHVHTFACPVLASQNELASGNSMPRWAPRARIGLSLGPSPIHAPNVYLVLNLVTGYFSQQYHCRFDDFFETTHHGGPDISSSTICWQQLAGLSHADQFLSELAQPTQCSMVSNDTPSEMLVPPDRSPASSFDHDITADKPQAPTQAEGANPTEHTTVSAGTSCIGRACIISQRMAKSFSQQDFFATT